MGFSAMTSRHAVRMAQFRKTDTGPECRLREALRRLHVRFEAYPTLPGTPDIVMERSHVVVFDHGCFWYGCTKHNRRPKGKLDHWIPKLARNKARDRAAKRKLRSLAWSVITVWECQVNADAAAVARRIRAFASRRRESLGQGDSRSPVATRSGRRGVVAKSRPCFASHV